MRAVYLLFAGLPGLFSVFLKSVFGKVYVALFTPGTWPPTDEPRCEALSAVCTCSCVCVCVCAEYLRE